MKNDSMQAVRDIHGADVTCAPRRLQALELRCMKEIGTGAAAAAAGARRRTLAAQWTMPCATLGCWDQLQQQRQRQ